MIYTPRTPRIAHASYTSTTFLKEIFIIKKTIKLFFVSSNEKLKINNYIQQSFRVKEDHFISRLVTGELCGRLPIRGSTEDNQVHEQSLKEFVQ